MVNFCWFLKKWIQWKIDIMSNFWGTSLKMEYTELILRHISLLYTIENRQIIPKKLLHKKLQWIKMFESHLCQHEIEGEKKPQKYKWKRGIIKIWRKCQCLCLSCCLQKERRKNLQHEIDWHIEKKKWNNFSTLNNNKKERWQNSALGYLFQNNSKIYSGPTKIHDQHQHTFRLRTQVFHFQMGENWTK